MGNCREQQRQIEHLIRFLMFFFKVFTESNCIFNAKEEECVIEHLKELVEILTERKFMIRQDLNHKLQLIHKKLLYLGMIEKSNSIHDLIQSNKSIFQ
jgi:hypothetical protein